MRQFLRISAAALAILAGTSFGLSAQTTTDQQADKELLESIDNEIERLTEMLDLDDAQIFYVDSILVHDYTEMQREFKALQEKKVSNADLYDAIQFKWQDQVYYSLQKVFNDEQWTRYLKSGAERNKKNRDKKRAKSGK